MPIHTNIESWTKKLGHLPVHLTPSVENKYIMLNGVSGNFCLHFSNEADESAAYFSQSWSSNTKNFLLVNADRIKLYNWNKSPQEEDIPIKSVQDNLEKFYSYLIAKSHKSEKDIVPIVIDIFKQFRTLTAESGNPVEALNLLFILLAGLEDGNAQNVNREKWGINGVQIPGAFDSYIERFRMGIGNIIPDLNLILRHSAGALFQEAQKEVVFFNNQLDLFGTFSGTMETRGLLYSSIHYTPSYLARSIVENVLRNINLSEFPDIKILDPACGSAEFLIEILKQLREKNYPGTVYIKGLDNSETAINTSNFLLTYEKRMVWDDKLTFDIQKVEDSLMENWANDYNIILMNPPFVSWELLSNLEKKDAVKEALKTAFIGKPNQASAFFYKSIQHLAVNGVLGCVVPSSLFTMDAYQKLRNELNEIFTIDLLGKLGNFVFEDALTDASIVIGRKPKNHEMIPTFLWTRNEKGIVHDALRELRKMQYAGEQTKERIDFSIFKPAHFPIIPDSWKPVSIKEHNLIRDLGRHLTLGKLAPVSDLFDVKQGVRSGKNDVFKILESQYSILSSEEKKYFRPVIENNSIRDGFLKEGRYIWFPYNENGLIIMDEHMLEISAPSFYTNNLLPNKDLLEKRAGINVWWELTRPRPWQFEKKKKLVSTEFGNSASFALDSKGTYVIERGYSWHPRKKIDNDDYFFYLALFSSPFFDRLLSVYSKELAGGKWYDLGKNRTKNIPIPNTNLVEIKSVSAYNKMIELGKRLSLGDSYVKSVLDDAVSIYYPQEI